MPHSAHPPTMLTMVARVGVKDSVPLAASISPQCLREHRQQANELLSALGSSIAQAPLRLHRSLDVGPGEYYAVHYIIVEGALCVLALGRRSYPKLTFRYLETVAQAFIEERSPGWQNAVNNAQPFAFKEFRTVIQKIRQRTPEKTATAASAVLQPTSTSIMHCIHPKFQLRAVRSRTGTSGSHVVDMNLDFSRWNPKWNGRERTVAVPVLKEGKELMGDMFGFEWSKWHTAARTNFAALQLEHHNSPMKMTAACVRLVVQCLLLLFNALIWRKLVVGSRSDSILPTYRHTATRRAEE